VILNSLIEPIRIVATQLVDLADAIPGGSSMVPAGLRKFAGRTATDAIAGMVGKAPKAASAQAAAEEAALDAMPMGLSRAEQQSRRKQADIFGKPSAIEPPAEEEKPTGGGKGKGRGKKRKKDEVVTDESILRYHCLVRRSRAYQWSLPEVTFVADGTWSGGTSPESLNLLPAALDFGIAEMTIAPAPSPKTNEWTYSCRGKAPPANLPDRGFVVFFDGDESPRVASRPFMGGSTGPTAGERTYQFTGEWEGRIAPGQRFRLGLVPETKPEFFRTTLPVPARFLKAAPTAPR
jgi:hypothetical protein